MYLPDMQKQFYVRKDALNTESLHLMSTPPPDLSHCWQLCSGMMGEQGTVTRK